MAAKTIGVVQIKGGVGRSTVSTTLAGELAKHGKVALIDCDQPQATSAAWAALRQATLGKTVLQAYTAVSHRELIALHARLAEAVDYVILDGAPRAGQTGRAILALSDLLLIPLAPSLAELWAVQDLLPAIAEVRELHPVEVRLLWNRFRAHTRMAQDLEGEAVKALGIKALRSKLGLRMAFVEALGTGETAAEVGDPVAAEEVGALIAEVRRLTR